MKTALGFLVAGKLHKEDLWRAWFAGSGATALFHCHAGHYVGGRVVDDQRTAGTVTGRLKATWQRTMGGHFALYEAFLQTDCTHLCLASESCIPIKPYADLRATLDAMPGLSLMNRLEAPAWFRATPELRRKIRRNIFPEMDEWVCSHEQWCILSREHVAVLVANKAEIVRCYIDCFADNESFMGTALRRWGCGHELVNWRTTWTDWPPNANHPHTYRSVDEDVLAECDERSFFLRKCNAGTGIGAVWARIGRAASPLPAAMPQPEGPPRLAVFAHLYYGELWPELLAYLNNVPEPFDLYVNLVDSMAEGVGLLAQRIGWEVPWAKVFISPNRGRDVGGLFRLLAEVPEGRQYAAWAFIHGKRSVHATPGARMDGNAWRKSLLDAVLGTPEQAAKCIAEVLRPGVGIAGTAKWIERVGSDYYETPILRAAGLDGPFPAAKFIAGTMFWAKGSLLDFWKGCPLKQAHFELDDPRINDTYAHQWERMVSVHAKSVGLETVGIAPPAAPRVPAKGQGKEFGTHFHRRQPYVIEFDTETWQFRELVRLILNAPNLRATGIELPTLTREGDTQTPLHELWYERWKAMGFQRLFNRFVAEDLLPRFGLDAAYVQATPSFRAQFAGNVAVGEMHRDCDYGHDSHEENFWMPFTDTADTNTVHIETEPGSGEFRPYPCRYGQVLVFNGAYLRHGNVPNAHWDRTSIDFRMVVPEYWNPSGKESVNGHRKFELGSYFERMEAAR